MPLDPKDREYLKSRGYTDLMIDREGWFSLPVGSLYNEFGLAQVLSRDTILSYCTTMAGTVTAVTTLSRHEKAYRRYKVTAGCFLPVFYGSSDDFSLLNQLGRVFLVEGIFDRVALKRARVPGAVFALQGLGLSSKMVDFLRLSAQQVWLVLDMDKPGLEARDQMRKVLLAAEVPQVNSIVYGYKDPGEWFQKRGSLYLSQAVNKAIELMGW